MTDRLEDTSLRLKDEMDLYRKMMDKLWQNRHEFQKEREAMQEVFPLLITHKHNPISILHLYICQIFLGKDTFDVVQSICFSQFVFLGNLDLGIATAVL